MSSKKPRTIIVSSDVEQRYPLAFLMGYLAVPLGLMHTENAELIIIVRLLVLFLVLFSGFLQLFLLTAASI